MKKKNNKIFYTFTIIYLLLLTIVCCFLLKNNSTNINTPITIMSILYLVFGIIIYYAINKQIVKGIINTLLVPICIFGGLFFLSSTVTLIEYGTNTLLQSPQIYDIQHDLTNILTYNKIDLHFDEQNKKLYIINNNKYSNKSSQYTVYTEDEMDSSTLSKTNTFIELNKNVKFSFLTDNINNEILLQINQNNKRFLAKIDNTGLVPLLEEKAEYKNPFMKIDNVNVYIDKTNKNLIYMNNENIAVFSYMEHNKKNNNYLIRTNEYLKKYYPSDYISEQNATTELIAEKYIKDIGKINLYNINCFSCNQRINKYSDIMEIIYKDGTTITTKANINPTKLSEVILCQK